VKLVSSRDVETRRAPEEWFTGTVWMGGTPASSPPDAGIFRVFFEPGTRTNWHTHPEGQILYVVTGEGRAQREGEPTVDISPGDVVYFAPGEKHWHGARRGRQPRHYDRRWHQLDGTGRGGGIFGQNQLKTTNEGTESERPRSPHFTDSRCSL
jgi:quercetin dioxygenase-like cupin family protein